MLHHNARNYVFFIFSIAVYFLVYIPRQKYFDLLISSPPWKKQRFQNKFLHPNPKTNSENLKIPNKFWDKTKLKIIIVT